MIVNKYANGGGGSGSGVTPAQVQTLIDSSLVPYWESGETKDYVDNAVSGISLEGYATSGDMQSAFTLISETQQVAAAGLNQLEGRIDELSAATPSVDLSGYYTSAQTEDAISAATSGKADAANVTGVAGAYTFPDWNTQGIITGAGPSLSSRFVNINGDPYASTMIVEYGGVGLSFYTPETAGNAGDILVSTGNGAPVWSAVTFPDVSNYVTSAQVETQIDTKAAAYTPTSGFSTINGSAITNGGNIVIEGGADMSAYYTSAQTDAAIAQAVSGLATEQYVQDALSGVNMDNYYTSAQTDAAISAATSGKADAVSVSANTGDYVFPAWNEDGVITGEVSKAYKNSIHLNNYPLYVYGLNRDNLSFFAPTAGGTAGQVLVSAGNGIPVWSSVTMPDMAAYTPTSGFSTINGSAITNGGNIVIEGGADMSAYYTSAQTEDAITSKNYITSAQVETQIVSKNYITSAEIADFVTSAQVETQIEAKNYVNSGDVKSQVEAYNYATVSQIPTVPTSNTAFTNDAGYITDAAIENLVTSAQVETQITSKGYATVSQIPTVPTSNTAFTNDAGYVTSAQVETQIVEKNYITSAAIANMVTSTYVSTIWRGTQSDYDAIVDKDPNTFYIIVNN